MREIVLAANEPYARLTGGIPRFLREIAPRLARRFRVTVLAAHDGRGTRRSLPARRLEVIEFPRLPVPIGDSAPPPFTPRRVGDAIARADLLFAQTVDCVVPIALAERAGKPWVLYLHGIDWEALPRAIGAPLLGRALVPVVRAVSRFWTNRARMLLLPSASMLPFARDAGFRAPIKVAPPGIDGARFRPPEDRAAARRALGIPEGAPVLGYTGRLAHEKNVALLFETFEELRPRFPDLRLLLVGPSLREYRLRARRDRRILAVGPTEDVLPYLHAMDLFLMPSRTETSSLSTMEAMSAGLPAVAFPVGCIPDYLVDGEGGRLADPVDPAGFRDAVAGLLADPVLRGRAGRAAREAMLRRGTWDTAADLLASAFEEILRDRGAGCGAARPGAARGGASGFSGGRAARTGRAVAS